MLCRYLFRVEHVIIVVVADVAGGPPGAGDPDAGDMAVRVGLPDEAGEGLAVVSGREPGVVLVRQARHRSSSCKGSIYLVELLVQRSCDRRWMLVYVISGEERASCAYKWGDLVAVAGEWVFSCEGCGRA